MTKSIYLFILFFSLSAQSEAVRSQIFNKGNWSAVVVDSHKGTGKSACIAYVQSKDQADRLEIYAEASTVDGFIEPVIQITTEKPGALLAGMMDGKFPLSIALREVAPPQQVLATTFLSLLGDRKKILSVIKNGDSLKVVLNGKGKVSRKVEFSLSGSSATIEKAFDACGVSID